MSEFIELYSAYSTTRRLRKVAPEVVKAELKAARKPEDQFETTLFLPEGEGRKGEGGLRTRGFFKKGSDEKPLITVITVVFNGVKYLEKTILSVINQTYDNVEYIIIDGGSADGTLDIVRKYEHAIDYWISEKDKGIYDAMNKGSCLALGLGLNFLNSGDFFYGDVFGNSIKLPYLVEYKTSSKNDLFFNSSKFRKIKNYKLGMPICHQAIFYENKKKIYNLNYSISSDYDYSIRANIFPFKNFNEFGFILYNNDGISNKKFIKRDLETLKIISKHYGQPYSIIFLILSLFKSFVKIVVFGK